jgi:hypothetical protein
MIIKVYLYCYSVILISEITIKDKKENRKEFNKDKLSLKVYTIKGKL